MDFKELIADLATRHNVADLVADNNAAALDIDGIIVIIVADGDRVTLSAEVGEPPAEGRADFADLMLEASLQTDAFFAKASESESYIVVQRLSLRVIDDAAFDAALETFVNQTETWRRLLSDFRPIAKTAAEKAKDNDSSLGASGFMQV
jgi:hypothetical protein